MAQFRPLPRLLHLLLLQLCSPGVAALQYAGMWGLHNGSSVTGPTTDRVATWTTLTFDVSDPDLILANAKLGVKALYPISWTAAQKELCYAPVPHTQTTPDGKFSCLTIDPDYKAKWKAQFAKMQPLIKAKALLGVFLGDEHMYFGVKVSEVKLIVDLIREDWPSAIIYENEAPDVAMCNYRKDNTTIWEDGECMPSNLDWFGFDYYAHDSSVWSGPREAYTSMVYPRFSRADQKVCTLARSVLHQRRHTHSCSCRCQAVEISLTPFAICDLLSSKQVVPVTLGYGEGNLSVKEAQVCTRKNSVNCC